MLMKLTLIVDKKTTGLGENDLLCYIFEDCLKVFDDRGVNDEVTSGHSIWRWNPDGLNPKDQFNKCSTCKCVLLVKHNSWD